MRTPPRLPVLLLLFGCLTFTAGATADTAAAPKNVVRSADGKWRPAPGFTWVNNSPNDLRVRWVSGMRHSEHPNVLAGLKENTWQAAPGYKWLNNTPGDLRVVRAGASDEAVARAVLKALGALVLHKAGTPQSDDDFAKSLLRAGARASRDRLIDGVLLDLFPGARAAERASVRNLAVLALDGRLSHDRDRVLAQLRLANPGMADAVPVAEFLIRLAKAVDKGR